MHPLGDDVPSVKRGADGRTQITSVPHLLVLSYSFSAPIQSRRAATDATLREKRTQRNPLERQGAQNPVTPSLTLYVLGNTFRLPVVTRSLVSFALKYFCRMGGPL